MANVAILIVLGFIILFGVFGMWAAAKEEENKSK